MPGSGVPGAGAHTLWDQSGAGGRELIWPYKLNLQILQILMQRQCATNMQHQVYCQWTVKFIVGLHITSSAWTHPIYTCLSHIGLVITWSYIDVRVCCQHAAGWLYDG